jgi:hypothetical protein
MPKTTPEELLRAIENAPTSTEEDADANGAPDPFDAAVAEVLAMTPEERRRELETAGVDVEKMHAETAALLGRAPAAAAPPPPVRDDQRKPPIPLPSRRRPGPLLLLAAALAIAVAAAAAYRTYFGPRVSPSPPEPPASAPAHTAHPPSSPSPSSDPALDIASLRREGVDACRVQRWQQCKERLDLADRYDPAGSRDPMVALARSQAALALRGAEAGPDDRTENAKQPPSAPAPRSSGPL